MPSWEAHRIVVEGSYSLPVHTYEANVEDIVKTRWATEIVEALNSTNLGEYGVRNTGPSVDCDKRKKMRSEYANHGREVQGENKKYTAEWRSHKCHMTCAGDDKWQWRIPLSVENERQWLRARGVSMRLTERFSLPIKPTRLELIIASQNS